MKIHYLIIPFIIIAIAVQGWFIYQDANKIDTINISASGTGDSFKMAHAIADITNKYFPKINMEVVSTGGSVESMNLLASNDVQLAMTQSDIKAAKNARLIAPIYPDLYQVITRNDTNINNVSDLQGRKIAIAKTTSGQYKSFWFLAEHYGLTNDNITAISMSSDKANQALIDGSVDALFRVRAPGNISIAQLTKDIDIKIIPISHASAIRLAEPVLIPAVIPQGSYSGNPAIPPVDITTIASNRILIASKNLDDEIAHNITSILFEHRQELQNHITLAGFIQQPDMTKGTSIPVHQGATNYYDRETPSFLQENAEVIALILTILAFGLSSILQIKTQKHRNKVRKYNSRLLEIQEELEIKKYTKTELQQIKIEINHLLQNVVKMRNKDHITSDNFDLFSFLWEMVNEKTQHTETADNPISLDKILPELRSKIQEDSTI